MNKFKFIILTLILLFTPLGNPFLTGFGFFKVEAGEKTLPKGSQTIMQEMVSECSRKEMLLREENQNLKEKLVALEASHIAEKATLYQELGSAYLQAELLDLAVDAYAKSVELNPDNPQAHYNLGLLYKESRDNNKKAIYHFKRYLKLKPEAKDRKDVEYLIEMLAAEKDRLKK